MSTYRERRIARAERLRDWAEKRGGRAAAAFKAAERAVEGIPMGQPILIGHHSERRHRRALERSDAAMRRGLESQKKAGDMAYHAANIEAAVDRAIYRDDPDAIERITAKLEGLEAQRERMKAENKAYRKGDAAYATLLGITVEQAAALRVTIEAGYSWCRQPHAAYELSNLGGTITKERKRLAQLTAAKTSRGIAYPNPSASSPIERAGLAIVETMTTPRRAWKKPRPVWNVSGNLEYWRPILVERLEGTAYGYSISFFDDPTESIAAEVSRLEDATETERSQAIAADVDTAREGRERVDAQRERDDDEPAPSAGYESDEVL